MKSTSNIRDFKYFQNSLGFKINKLSKELKRYSSKIIKAYPSLGIPELFTLNVIGENKKEVTIKYIASVHWADQAEISRGVQKLIKLSLVNKAKNHDDLRYTLLQVTSDGKKIHRELLKKQTDRNKKLLKDFVLKVSSFGSSKIFMFLVNTFEERALIRPRFFTFLFSFVSLVCPLCLGPCAIPPPTKIGAVILPCLAPPYPFC